MSSSSTSGIIRKPKLFKVDLDGNVYCHHDIVARGDCKFFLWKEDADNMFIERSNDTSTQVKSVCKITMQSTLT
ncbi:hypothetical protein Hanom_Chr02g00165701 [Helianthus anomalus]